MKNREIIKGITGILFLFILAFLAGRFLAQAVDAVSSSSVLPAEGNWGLSFREDGKPPVANASFEELAKYNAFYAENTPEKVLYLTFDCGFENGNTPAILDALKKHNVKATFFIVGNYLETSPDLVKRMLDEGHIVGNHSYHHPDMSKISDKQSFEKELKDLNRIVTMYLDYAELQAESHNAMTMKDWVEKLNVFLNTQGSFNVYPKGNSTEQATFKMNQLRLEIKGNINPWIFYRYRIHPDK